MNTAAKVLKIDLGVQLILLGVLLGSLLGAVFIMNKSLLVWFLVSLGILGIWQLLSALLIGIIYKDATRWKYLAVVAIYFMGVGFVVGWLKSMGLTSDVYYDMLHWGIPTVFGIWYANRTYFDIKKINDYPRSFWDLT